MTVRVAELNRHNCKTYLIVSGTEAALIDPVREHIERYRREIDASGAKLTMILETHTHADHLMLSRTEKQLLGAPVFMARQSPSPVVDRHLVEGDELPLGDVTIKVLHTPGHTPDALSYLLPGMVFTGDALLIGGSGRTDFPGGDPGVAYDSVVDKLFRLPDDTVVWPGHDYRGQTTSTIGNERRNNPRFAGTSREQYIDLMNNLGLPFPDRIQQALQVNQAGFESEEVGGFPLVADVARVPLVSAAELAVAVQQDPAPLILDVREPEEFVGELGHIPGALLVPMDALQRRLPKLAGYIDRDIVVVCRAGARSASAAAILQRAGFPRVRNLDGGMLAWAKAGQPVAH
jgi:sulfur dioxygenase